MPSHVLSVVAAGVLVEPNNAFEVKIQLSAWCLETWKGGFTGLAHATGTSPPFKDGRARLSQLNQSKIIQMPKCSS